MNIKHASMYSISLDKVCGMSKKHAANPACLFSLLVMIAVVQ